MPIPTTNTPQCRDITVTSMSLCAGVAASQDQDFGTANLHVEVSDIVSILVYVGVAKGNGVLSKTGENPPLLIHTHSQTHENKGADLDLHTAAAHQASDRPVSKEMSLYVDSFHWLTEHNCWT